MYSAHTQVQQIFHSYHARCFISTELTRRGRSQRRCMHATDRPHKELACERNMFAHTKCQDPRTTPVITKLAVIACAGQMASVCAKPQMCRSVT